MSKIILIHGGWCGAWCWDKVTPFLKAQNLDFLAIDLPGHGDNNPQDIEKVNLKTYVDYILEIINKCEQKVILVAHSMSGMIVSQVAENIPQKVERIIYVSAFVPMKSGDTNQQYIENDIYSFVNPKTITFVNEKLCTFDMRYARNVGFNLTNDEDFFWAASKMQLESAVMWGEKIWVSDKFENVPKFYIHGLKDNCVSYNLQLQICANVPMYKEYYIDGPHTLMISFPKEVAQSIIDAANYPLQMPN